MFQLFSKLLEGKQLCIVPHAHAHAHSHTHSHAHNHTHGYAHGHAHNHITQHSVGLPAAPRRGLQGAADLPSIITTHPGWVP